MFHHRSERNKIINKPETECTEIARQRKLNLRQDRAPLDALLQTANCWYFSSKDFPGKSVSRPAVYIYDPWMESLLCVPGMFQLWQIIEK